SVRMVLRAVERQRVVTRRPRRYDVEVPLDLRPIERVHAPTIPEFDARWGSRLRPVVITGAIDGWPALQGWTLDHLRAVHGDRLVGVRLSPIDARQRHTGD